VYHSGTPGKGRCPTISHWGVYRSTASRFNRNQARPSLTEPIKSCDRMNLYFAYGSNLCIQRLTERAPTATVLSVGCVPGFVLTFHKRGMDGSGKCTLRESGLDTDAVFGAVYLLDREDREGLDRAECLGTGYDAVEIGVVTPAGPLRAFTYVARETHIDASLLPFAWYLEYVLTGAYQHRLPDYYVSRLESVQTLPDPDTGRAEKNRLLMAAA